MTQNTSAIASAREDKTAAGRRARRIAAAQLFSACPFRGDLEWSHFEHLPDWAALPPQAVANFEWVTGAWAHAYSLHRCIDGKILAAVRQRLGDGGMAALMKAGETTAERQADNLQLDVSDYRPKDLDGVFSTTGREWLLASVTSPMLRRALRERFWPGTTEVVERVPGTASAQALVLTVIAAFGAATPAKEKP